MLEQKLIDIPEIGKRRASMLEKLGLYTLHDLLFYMPRDYKNFSETVPAAALEEGERCALLRIASEPRAAYPRRGLSIVTAEGMDETGKAKIVWYNQPFRKKQLEAGRSYLVYGNVKKKGRIASFENPDIEAVENIGEGVSARGILPVYSLTAGVGQKTIRSSTQLALEVVRGQLPETIEEGIRSRFKLVEINYALSQIHFPDSLQSLDAAKRRLGVEELLCFLLAVEAMKSKREQEEGIAFSCEGLLEEFLAKLPFEPTEAQRQVLQEIEVDMSKKVQMNRLVQGDVGAGKTVLALFALYVAQKNGYQGALMVPTEILAKQHVEQVRRIFGQDVRVELLTGSLTEKEKRRLQQDIAEGKVDIVVGTHALIQDAVKFARLGIVIADEQHRFGVKQRGALSQGSHADTLIMSATPIPRTMTLILYGDLDVSILSGMPPGRKPVLTRLVPMRKRSDLYEYIAERAKQAKQSYVVCPLVEEDEQSNTKSAEALVKELRTGVLKGMDVGLLHGRMNAKEKEAVLESFRDGEISVLVSTTVIEVGVDVPNATVMVIENAERFGLAQLHQLRGRVGRGSEQSWCFLLSSAENQDTMDRLQILCESNDGFEIAQRDLELRGPGEFLGTRQSGSANTSLLRLLGSQSAVEETQALVKCVLNEQKGENENRALQEELEMHYGARLRGLAMN